MQIDPSTSTRLLKVLPIVVSLVLSLGLGLFAAHQVRAEKHRRSAPQISGSRPNILLIVTDDQDKSTFDVMRSTNKYFQQEGTDFVNGRVTTPLCCPSRASMYSGLYAHNHRILTNNPSKQFAKTYRPRQTFPWLLRESGYRTGQFGKYLNNWSIGNEGKAGFDVFDNDYLKTEHRRKERGLSDDITINRAIRFIKQNETDDDQPWMATVALRSPHTPLIPSERFQAAKVPGFDPPPSWKEKDRSDKPPYLADKLSPHSKRATNTRYKRYKRTLLSADDGVRNIMEELGRYGEDEDTLAIFISDNGFLFGQHDLLGKVYAYREGTNVPFLARWPGVIGKGVTDRRLAANIDLAPTFYDVAGIDPGYRTDGASLFSPASNRRYLLTESVRWRAIQDSRGVLIESTDPKDGSIWTERYDWDRDPDELDGTLITDNLIEVARTERLRAALRAAENCAGASCP